MKALNKFWIASTIALCATSIAAECYAVGSSTPDSKSKSASASKSPPGKDAAASDKKKQFSGNVSWYGPGFNGRKTANGERFDMMKLTAAHLKLKFNTKVLVEDPRTGNTVVVRVNDRGPYHAKRVMDLSKGGMTKLGTISRGIVFVDCLILDDETQ